MKIPNEIRINGVEFSVGYAPNLRMNDKLCFGYIDFNNSKIMLSETDGTEHQQRCITFLHEVIHGIIKNSAVEVFDEDDYDESKSPLLKKFLDRLCIEDNYFDDRFTFVQYIP